MKKLATILLVAILAVSCICVLAACEDNETILANPESEYSITGQWNGWTLNYDAEDATKLDSAYVMEAIARGDSRVDSIRSQLKKLKYLYIIQFTFEEGAGWTQSYVLEKGAEPTVLDGNLCIKVLCATNDELGWGFSWLPDAEGTTFKSLTPDTLYMPPHSQEELWEGSGAWNDNPVVLEVGTYNIVFAQFQDNTYGLGAIKVEAAA